MQGLASTILKIIFLKLVELRMTIISVIERGDIFIFLIAKKLWLYHLSMVDNFQKGKDYSGAKFFLYRAFILEQSSLDKMKGI